ncbi:LOW QUALITY PROTEIN: orexin/Hypocretin receptor type 1-like [Homalodisca vitripennis]|uniref:LOW QUALITY PROTEIN: orexin/Hypocretin receptor type 1-like n=1 Tax=Homalodisca vitripennis TaxID=197043 RepID=UPI001EEA777B|nr:LOW QUALITY PROTEIN: orexin/Hypocretin receptor type 1-like [Homalodisca vitripennis]
MRVSRRPMTSMALAPASEGEVARVLRSLKAKKSCDIQGVSSWERSRDHEWFTVELYVSIRITSMYCSTDHAARNSYSLYDVPGGLIALLSVFYGTISVVAVVGNSLVMWIVATSRRMQNVTNCFIANLALADIVIGLFAIPFQVKIIIYATLLQRWNQPHFMCAFCPFVQVLTVNVSVFTLTAIAVDRHRDILNPLSARPSKLRAKISIACIWCVAGILAVPMAIALRVAIVEEVDSSRYRYINVIWFCCDWLAMSNSCYNPFIYGIYNVKFFEKFKQRFPFHQRKWMTGSGGDSVDLEKTYLGGRGSVHSSHSPGYDWRRSYRATSHNGAAQYSRASSRAKDLYVFHNKSSTVVRQASNTELEELCL